MDWRNSLTWFVLGFLLSITCGTIFGLRMGIFLPGNRYLRYQTRVIAVIIFSMWLRVFLVRVIGIALP